MARLSAGLLLYRSRSDAGAVDAANRPEVLLVHPGGPWWRGRDLHSWSIPKGEVEPGEDPRAVAGREFAEELGRPAPVGPWLDLGDVVQAGGKRVRAWALRGDFDTGAARSNTFEIEWPPRSGRRQRFPEIDRAEWTPTDAARRKLVPGQVPLVDRLLAALGAAPAGGPPVP